MDEKIRCYNCMEMKPARFRICPYCGYPDDKPYDPDYAPPGTELNERYTLGVKIGHNSEGANYIGYNASIGCKVLIREYMPVGLCKRVRGRATISVPSEHVVQYKALMAEFTDLNRNLAQMRNLQHIIPTLDMFTANNTTYVVYEYLEGIKLVEYLKEHAGELTWHHVSSMFPTFFTTLSLMHNNHVIHRAISPDTIYVTPKGELQLCGFSIYAVRTLHLELPSEIFQGYAAPEQYTPGAKQDTFTDVYGICAVLYRLLTGCQPVDAPSRLRQDNLSAPYELNQNIPKNVSDAIMKGMCLNSEQRTQTITELVTQLFEQTEESAEAKDIPPEPPRKKKKQTDKKKSPDTSPDDNKVDIDYAVSGQESIIDRFRMPLIVIVMTMCILLVIAIILVNLGGSSPVTMNSQTETTTIATESETENNIVTESSAEAELPTEAPGDSQMPLLIGMSYELKKEQLETDGWLYLEPVYAFSDTYKAGLIIEQEIEAGQPFHSGAVVKVVVSKGPSSIQIPDYTGKTLKDYEAELEALGLTNYNTEAIVNYSFETGYVVELNKEAGETFDLTGEETLKIFYASNPETTPVVITEPVQTTVATEPETIPETEAMTDDVGVVLETAPPIAPDSEQEFTQEAPETAPNLNSETTVPDYETAPPVPNDFE
ncbi:MAG: PASTA domain-containing protein [Oscillospiraceae bacterium]|nr:PASTA domain-containing protein [Oscillospiraceae bacterium]